MEIYFDAFCLTKCARRPELRWSTDLTIIENQIERFLWVML